MLSSQTKSSQGFTPVINVPQNLNLEHNAMNTPRFPDNQSSINKLISDRTHTDYRLTTSCDLDRLGREMNPKLQSKCSCNTEELDESMIKHHKFQIFINEKRTVHPVIFLQSFRGLLPETWSEKRKIRFVVGYIQGEAGIWANEALQLYDTYGEFERAFLSTFWSPVVQERFRNEVYNPQPFDGRNGSLRRYFEKYLNKAKFFDDPLPHREVLRVLINKLPTRLRLQLANVQTYDLQSFLSMLDTLDLIFEDDRARHYNNGYGNGNRFLNQYNNHLIPVSQQPQAGNQNMSQSQPILLQ